MFDHFDDKESQMRSAWKCSLQLKNEMNGFGTIIFQTSLYCQEFYFK